VVDLSLGERTISGHLIPAGLDGLLPKEKIKELQQFGQGAHAFTTVKVDDVTLIPELEAAGVQFQGQIEDHWFGTLLSWIVPALVFVMVWGVALKRMGMGKGLLSLGKSKAKVYVERVTGVTSLMQHEVVDRNPLDRLLATPVPQAAASALMPE
jgi:cell division protease FtsH